MTEANSSVMCNQPCKVIRHHTVPYVTESIAFAVSVVTLSFFSRRDLRIRSDLYHSSQVCSAEIGWHNIRRCSMPTDTRFKLIRRQDSEVKVRLTFCYVLRLQVIHRMLPVVPQVGRTVFYLLERVNEDLNTASSSSRSKLPFGS